MSQCDVIRLNSIIKRSAAVELAGDVTEDRSATNNGKSERERERETSLE